MTSTTVDGRPALWRAAFVLGVAKSEAAGDAGRPMGRARSSSGSDTSPAVSGSGSVNGQHSQAWWHAIAICEQGGRNDPFFGYFSIMDGSAGGLDWATQVQMAQRIIDRAGDHAWASKCVDEAYAAAPGG